MNDRNSINRRSFLGTAMAAGALGLAGRALPAMAQSSGTSSLPSRGEFVIRGAYVMSMDPAIGDLARGDIHVRNGEIVAVAASVDAPGATVIDGANRLAMPGFVETHFHLWTSFLRGLIGDGPMDYFPVVTRVGPHITPEVAYHSVRLAIAESLYSGLTTIHDWSHNILSPAHADADIRALREMGIRARFGYGYSRPLQKKPDETMDFADVQRVQKELSGDPLLTVGVCLRGAGDTKPATYRKEFEMARKLDLPISMHAGRSLREIRRIHRIKLLHDEGLLGPDVLLIHTYNASEEERGMMAATKTAVSTSPFTASRLASGLPWLGDLLKRGVQCSFSVDTTTVGGNTDMFGVMRLALQLNHLRSMNVLEVQPRKIVELATIEGARSLGIADSVGSLTPGKRADLILIRTDDINVAPFHDPALLVVEAAQPHNVDTVVVDGRILKQNRQMTGIDLAEVVRGAARVQTELWSRHGIRKKG